MAVIALVDHPDSAAMDSLCETLAQWSPRWQTIHDWPADAIELCARAGVYRWFAAEKDGGMGWDDVDQTRGYLRLAAVDLTTTFIITQFMGACRRIAGSNHQAIAEKWLPALLAGRSFASVGISHLTTSRRHLASPVLRAIVDGDGFRLSGMSPWVTGAAPADLLVVGATLDDGREILAAVSTTLPGVIAGEGLELMALSASKTDKTEFHDVRIDESMVLTGPVENVMRTGTGAGTGGLQTSTLAVGLSRAAVKFLAQEAENRGDLLAASDELVREVDELQAKLLRAAAGDASCDAGDLRANANRLALRTTQAALVAAKGAGYIDKHPVGRWCREAMFFLVWSCPQSVSQAHLCELAGIV